MSRCLTKFNFWSVICDCVLLLWFVMDCVLLDIKYSQFGFHVAVVAVVAVIAVVAVTVVAAIKAVAEVTAVTSLYIQVLPHKIGIPKTINGVLFLKSKRSS
jgi:hypothetical protein